MGGVFALVGQDGVGGPPRGWTGATLPTGYRTGPAAAGESYAVIRPGHAGRVSACAGRLPIGCECRVSLPSRMRDLRFSRLIERLFATPPSLGQPAALHVATTAMQGTDGSCCEGGRATRTSCAIRPLARGKNPPFAVPFDAERLPVVGVAKHARQSAHAAFRIPCTGASRTKRRRVPSCVHFGHSHSRASETFGTIENRTAPGSRPQRIARPHRKRRPWVPRVPLSENLSIEAKGPRSPGTASGITSNREGGVRGGRTAPRGRSSWSSFPSS